MIAHPFHHSLGHREDKPPTPLAVPATSSPGPGRETVLIVEAEDPVRDLEQTVLRAEGYVVLTAASGSEALELSGGHPGPIHLVVTDVAMPDMNGAELCRRLKALRPGMKVLYLSGHPDETLAWLGLQDGVVLLRKPFGLDELRATVRAVLDRPAGA